MCTCLENTTPCENQECGCKFEVDAGCVRYSGSNLDSSGIISGDTLETTLISISNKIGELSPGDYITMADEPAGDNCEFGGVKLELRDGVTNLIKSTSFICGVDTENNAQGSVQNVSFQVLENGNNVSSSITSPDQFPAITLNIPIASATKTGKISASDWNKFNNKQDALLGTTNYITKWSATDDLTDSIMYETPGGLLGVGLTTPSAKFHISNTTPASNSFLVEDEASVDSTPFVINNSGNVGIGVAAPSTKLQILAATSINNTTLANAPLLVGTSTLGIGIGANEIYSATPLNVGTFGSTSDILFKPNATQRVVVKANTGNVGIGIADPSAKLHVNSITAGVNSFLVEDEASVDSTPFVITDSGSVGVGILAPTAKMHIKSTQAGLAPFLVEDTDPDVTPFIIDADGNVGIGTDTPGTKLEVLKTQTPWDEVAIFRFASISDAYLSLRSGKNASDRFVPEVRGYQNSTKTERALSLSGVIDSSQDTHINTLNGFLYGSEEPAVLFKAGKGSFSSDSDNLTDRKIFEFRNMNRPILSMDPTGGIKVYRGSQQVGQPANNAQYTQFTHINGDGAGNYVTSYSTIENTKPLVLQSTTDESHTPTSNTASEAFPGILFKVYDKTAALITRDGNVGIGTSKNFVNVDARLHVTSATRPAEGGVETPGTPGEAFKMWEGVPTFNKVMIANDGLGSATWGKVNADHMDTSGYTGTVRVSAPNASGYRDFYIKNGIITTILPAS
jgi:hypothetical protein